MKILNCPASFVMKSHVKITRGYPDVYYGVMEME